MVGDNFEESVTLIVLQIGKHQSFITILKSFNSAFLLSRIAVHLDTNRAVSFIRITGANSSDLHRTIVLLVDVLPVYIFQFIRFFNRTEISWSYTASKAS
jgi:hypothetical protein